MGVCIGVDVAKKHLDWVLGPNGKVERIENTPAAVRRLVRRLRKLDFDRVVLDGIVNGAGRLAKWIAGICGWTDKNVVDGTANGLAFVTQIFGAIARIFQTGFLTHYITSVAVAAVLGLALFGGNMQWVLMGLLPVTFFGFVFLARRA